MKLDINNSRFFTYLDVVSKNILEYVNIKEYFKLSEEQKLTISYTIFTFFKTKTKIDSNDLKMFITYLRKKNEIDENYELASILNNIIKNYGNLNELFDVKIKEIKKKKTENR